MHYKIAKGVVVRTENAAKSDKQPSTFLVNLISKLPPVQSAFDVGCGKLRYTKTILETTDSLALTDSEIQLSRLQILCGAQTSIRGHFRGSNRISIYNESQFANLRRRFDRGFCINVLPVIPIAARRRKVLEVIRSKLKRKGCCLFVVQYRNSDFDRMRKMPNAKPWLDGFLIDSLRGFSFYGLISPDHLSRMLRKAGFVVRDVALNEGSAYVWAAPY